ncbi:MAG TPA: Gfo/Idh/MocA family oxidoreductase [Candidatus Hydrogenedentes bacterium]|nr:Gfo/Idh/MocA family oxidoreductase [Candidatus Hydrogenedentota bacterium]HOV74177.1 Gfo/Idh/MocA family oxidoreductase [Candidatus Hydrogenedentota bacterium]HPC15716.1 Gfo/Idh/MocA family oxidoreductase [Candidatus Hydrogenedentota bacterium]HRT19660.1 Gfo/Idh/MocA family oxidoreductase [Candidatus Hydrogenedentota bacterium]HRT64434.1 Gfo/Idh/MocA family oxidoreductase [Candidatus Hydrogenedentota bacterium]
MATPVRWGILGTARIGRAVMRGIGMGVSSCVQAVASRNWTRASEWAKEHGIPRAFGSYDDLIRSREIDVLYNPLPNSMHAEWTLKSIEAGIPVLCEKPFAINAQQAREMAAAAKRKGVLLAEAFMYRFHPMYDEILARIAAGAIGELVSMRSCFTFRLSDRETNIRASASLAGGALMDVGCYCVNLARLVAGCEPVHAQAVSRRTSVDDTLMGQLVFPGGILAQFECSIENYARSHADIVGTEGMIHIPSPWFPGEDKACFFIRRGGHEEVVETPGANCYHLEVEDFVRSYKTHQPPRWTPEDAVANMAVIDALYRSAEEGKTVAV